MPTPDLSVIICTYNRGLLLRRVLEALDRQTLGRRLDWELVLVDNNSTDDTRRLAESQAEGATYPLRYVFEPRQGKSFALNTGIARSRGELLVFTDDDVLLDPGWLSALHAAWQESGYEAFGGRVLPLLDGPLPDWLAAEGRHRVIGGPLVSHDRGLRRRPYDGGMYVPAGCNMAFTRRLHARFGGFDLRLGHLSANEMICGEDSDIMLRFKRGGVPILYVPEALVHHPAPAERLRKSYFRRYFWGAGRGAARRTEVPADAVRYVNIPRYHLLATARQSLRLLRALAARDGGLSFYHELQLVFQLGMLFEYYSQAD